MRPRKHRFVHAHPGCNYFKPRGIRLAELDETVLTVDEYEALRLKDLEELDQTAAAENMHISQPTFNRLLNSARKKVSDAIVNGKAIKIQGGNYRIAQRGCKHCD